MNNSSDKQLIHVIGTDAGGIENLPLSLQSILLSCEGIAAPNRMIKNLEVWLSKNAQKPVAPEILISDNPKQLIKWLKIKHGPKVVLASGDPLWFGIGRYLIKEIAPERLIFHPAPSSLQLAFSRIGRPWQDASWISLHGREPETLANALQKRPPSLAILTDPNRGGAEEVRKILIASDLEAAYSFWICENLGNPEEKVNQIESNEEIKSNLSSLHIVILIARKYPQKEQSSLPLFGLEDGVFIQHEDRPGLMTKREIRIQLLSDLELPLNGVLWDIGAGVGSVGLEALRLRPKLKLLAIDQRLGTYSLIKSNADLLGVNPSAIIEEEIIKYLNEAIIPLELARPDRVLIGGGGNSMKSIINEIMKRISKKGIIVIPFATIEGIAEVKSTLKDFNCSIKVSQHQSWRGLPLSTGTRMAPMNPVHIVKCIVK